MSLIKRMKSHGYMSLLKQMNANLHGYTSHFTHINVWKCVFVHVPVYIYICQVECVHSFDELTRSRHFSVLQRVAVCLSRYHEACRYVYQCVAVWRSLLQRVVCATS